MSLAGIIGVDWGVAARYGEIRTLHGNSRRYVFRLLAKALACQNRTFRALWLYCSV